VLWFGKGIAGDDTHGHVDDLARFVNPTHHRAGGQEKNGADANYRPLAENWERVPAFRLQDGTRPEVVALPMPAPVVFNGQRLPASYANFYICQCRRAGADLQRSQRSGGPGHPGGTHHATGPSSACMPWIWCGGWAPCTA
jgi:hypothetical protein